MSIRPTHARFIHPHRDRPLVSDLPGAGCVEGEVLAAEDGEEPTAGVAWAKVLLHRVRPLGALGNAGCGIGSSCVSFPRPRRRSSLWPDGQPECSAVEEAGGGTPRGVLLISHVGNGNAQGTHYTIWTGRQIPLAWSVIGNFAPATTACVSPQLEAVGGRPHGLSGWGWLAAQPSTKYDCVTASAKASSRT